jgi:hypothetical protein
MIMSVSLDEAQARLQELVKQLGSGDEMWLAAAAKWYELGLALPGGSRQGRKRRNQSRWA